MSPIKRLGKVADVLGNEALEPDARAKAKIAALNEEIHTIYLADRQYWQRGQAATLEERAEYHRRQERLEEIRKEHALLRSA